MTHPGLPVPWLLLIGAATFVLAGLLFTPVMAARHGWSVALFRQLPHQDRSLLDQARPNSLMLLAKIIVAGLFLLIIAAGLIGTPIAERNIATVITWNIWWAGLIVSVFFLGSSWCAVCPWDTIATWLVRRRWWRRAEPNNSLNLRFPKALRNSWPAMFMLISLTWLELGVGVTNDPYLTAVLALAMLVAATVCLAVFEKKAFCRYVCPVGRTVGAYAQLAPVELRPVDASICATCTTLECFHGNALVEPCPTQLVMGRLTQNTYCTSCGNCQRSCPSQNVGWRARSPTRELGADARPRRDAAWFMLGLLALTWFHGITMMPAFEPWLGAVASLLGDSGQLLMSFSFLMTLALSVPILLFATSIAVTRYLLNRASEGFAALFSTFAFATLPIAFAYHLAHNLNHLIREAPGLAALFVNPFGIDAAPLSMMEKHMRHQDLLVSQDALFALQALLMIFGAWLSFRVIKQRAEMLRLRSIIALLPMVGFIIVMTGLHSWLLSLPMTMRL